jgi:hypothetical protein
MKAIQGIAVVIFVALIGWIVYLTWKQSAQTASWSGLSGADGGTNPYPVATTAGTEVGGSLSTGVMSALAEAFKVTILEPIEGIGAAFSDLFGLGANDPAPAATSWSGVSQGDSALVSGDLAQYGPGDPAAANGGS